MVRYSVESEYVWKALPRGRKYVPTVRTIGYACVNTAEFYEKVEVQGRHILGGGTLRVRFELETGTIIGRPCVISNARAPKGAGIKNPGAKRRAAQPCLPGRSAPLKHCTSSCSILRPCGRSRRRGRCHPWR